MTASAAYGVPDDVPESAVENCWWEHAGLPASHVAHAWVEQVDSADYEQYWCPGLPPQPTSSAPSEGGA